MRAPLPGSVTILKHCRCEDCRNFFDVAGEYFCSEHVGGTKVRWSDGHRECDPPPDAWHYCAYYHGPQVSRDVWVWPKGSPLDHDVGPRSHDSRGGDQEAKAPTEAHTGKPIANRYFPATQSGDRGGNSRQYRQTCLRFEKNIEGAKKP